MSAGQSESWPFVELVASVEDADAFGSALLDAGSTGVEHTELGNGQTVVRAWFADQPNLESIAATVLAADCVEPARARAAAESITIGSTPNDDWLRLWKTGFEPVPVGSRLLVFPSWKRDETAEYSDRVLIEIDPGMAFGTGTHETTRLCLEWLDANWQGGSLLDVGTGTGILAIAAALLAPGSFVRAIDVDSVAIDVARENAGLNSVLDRIRFEAAGPEAIDGSYDVVLANLTADVIQSVAGSLVRLARSGGRIVVSGVLAEQESWLTSDLVATGLELVTRHGAGEWVALVFKTP